MPDPLYCPYRVLKVANDATQQDIKSAYRARALDTHPDRAPPQDRAASAEQFKLVVRAYEILSDPIRRAQYDRSRPQSTCVASRRPQQDVPHSQQQQHQRPYQHQYHEQPCPSYGPAPSTSPFDISSGPIRAAACSAPRTSPPIPPPMTGFQTYTWPGQAQDFWPPATPPPILHSGTYVASGMGVPAARSHLGCEPLPERLTSGQTWMSSREGALHDWPPSNPFDDPVFSWEGWDEPLDDAWSCRASRFERHAASFGNCTAERPFDWRSSSVPAHSAEPTQSSTGSARRSFSSFQFSGSLRGKIHGDRLVFDGSFHGEFEERRPPFGCGRPTRAFMYPA